MPLLVSRNTISFTRLPYNICTGYKIYAKEYVSGTITEYLLDTIQNLKTTAMTVERKTFQYNLYKEWQLPEDATASTSQEAKVYINNVELDTTMYTYNPTFKTLKIHCPITENDLIEAEYCVDRITYQHATPFPCEYKIVPIYRNSHTFGQHTLL